MPNQVRLRVLIAEDDEAQREILGEVLEHEGYQVLTAKTPDEVLAQLRQRPDALILDVWGVSSATVFAALGRMPDRPACLLVSGDDGAASVIASRLGAEGFLAKPFDVETLLERLRQALHRRQGLDEAPQFGAP